MRGELLNLTFHGIGPVDRALDAGEDRVWIDAERLHEVLDAVTNRPDVVITFDDGNRSDLEIGVPALQARGLSATFFVVAGRLGTPGFLSAEDVRTLLAEGMTVGCHGMRHRPWRGLDDAALEEELVTAKAEIEAAAGRPVTLAGCPFGAYDRRSLRALRRAGYRRVYTSDRGLARAGDWLQARNTITPDARLDAVLSPHASGGRTLARRAKLLAKRWR
jgi:peptidoglycan/xylan/chitin deacetylase (PgdA/CDA1 family)